MTGRWKILGLFLVFIMLLAACGEYARRMLDTDG